MAVLLTAWLFYVLYWMLRMPILVHAEGKPKFRDTPRKKYSAYLGDSIKLKCPVSGTDGPPDNRTLVAWFKGANIIHFNTPPEWQRFSKKNEKHLKIVSVKKEDAGSYKCIGQNEHGSVDLSVQLEVKGTRKPGRGKPPEFKKPWKKRRTYKTGETAKLHCESYGDPDPNVQWFKDGKSYGLNKRTSVGSDGWTLNLRYLTVADTGKYTCRVSNSVGSINRTFTVIVKARILKPIIEEPEVDKLIATQGRTVKFECKATSVGKLSFNWMWTAKGANRSVELRNSHRFDSKYTANYTRTHVVSLNQFYFDGFLVIRDVRKEDEGKYTCLVKNSYGVDEMEYHLDVRKRGSHLSDTDFSDTDYHPVPGNKWTTPRPEVASTKRQVQATEGEISIVLVAVVTTSIVVVMVFMFVLIMYCRTQRKNLEKKYVSEYQPQDVLQPYTHQINVSHEMQKVDQNFTTAYNANYTPPTKTSKYVLKTSKESIGSDSRPTNEPSSSSEIYLANSRTSLQTTLCRTCPRHISLDRGSPHHSLPRTTPGVQGVPAPDILSRGGSSPRVLTTDGRNVWESQSSLDDSPRNTSPQRSRESIV